VADRSNVIHTPAVQHGGGDWQSSAWTCAAQWVTSEELALAATISRPARARKVTPAIEYRAGGPKGSRDAESIVGRDAAWPVGPLFCDRQCPHDGIGGAGVDGHAGLHAPTALRISAAKAKAATPHSNLTAPTPRSSIEVDDSSDARGCAMRAPSGRCVGRRIPSERATWRGGGCGDGARVGAHRGPVGARRWLHPRH